MLTLTELISQDSVETTAASLDMYVSGNTA